MAIADPVNVKVLVITSPSAFSSFPMVSFFVSVQCTLIVDCLFVTKICDFYNA